MEQARTRAEIHRRPAHKRRRLIAGIAGLAVIGLVAATLVYNGGIPFGNKASAVTRRSDATTTTVFKLSARDKAALAVKISDTDCVALVAKHNVQIVKAGNFQLVAFDIGALKHPAPAGPRITADALSVPLTGNTPAEKLESLKSSVCSDPLVGCTVGHYFAHTAVADFKLFDHNPWLKPFNVDASRINDCAMTYDLPPTATDAAVAKANLAYQNLAELLDTLIGRFTLSGVQAEQSVLNYHLAGPMVGIPEVELNSHQENLPALVLEWTEKGACAPIKVFGFNVADQRPEEFAPPFCVKPATKPSPTRPRSHQPPNTSRTTPHTTPHTVPPTSPHTTPTTVHHGCTSGKCTPANTLAPPPVTVTIPQATTPTTLPPNDSGDGAQNTVPTPPTVDTAPAPPVTSPPVTRPSGPPNP